MITARDPIGRLVYSDYTNTTAMNRWIHRKFLTYLCDRQIFAGIRIWQFIQWLGTHSKAHYKVTCTFTTCSFDRYYTIESSMRHELCTLTHTESQEITKRLYKEEL